MAQVQHTFYGYGNPNNNGETANLTGEQEGVHHYMDQSNRSLWMSMPWGGGEGVEWVLIYGEDSDAPVEA